MLEPTSQRPRSSLCIPTSSEVVLDARAYKPAPSLSPLHTHLVRGGSLMLEPTTRVVPPRLRHTHLMRRGSLMLEPTQRS